MMTFRIFTNDRGKQAGVFMYSAFRDIDAATAKEAEELTEREFGPFAYRGEHGPIKAIEWPPAAKTDTAWLDMHVGRA
jgi:hypothetical protein